MKTTKIFMMAALALAFAACSNEDNELLAPEQGELIPFKATIRIDNGKASNRALAEDGSGLTATWAVGDHVALVTNSTIYNVEVSSVNEGVATITGSITSYSGAPAKIVYPYDACKDADGQIKDDYLCTQEGGMLADVASNYDVRTGEGTIKVESGIASLDGIVSVTNQNAIFKFTTKNADGSATIAMSSLTAYIGTKTYTITPTTASSDIYAALPAVSGQDVSFSATGSDGKNYIFSKSGVTFAASKYYKSTLKMTQGANLSKLTAAYTAQNGDKLTGTLGSNVKISIADGATVTLDGLSINGTNNSDYGWAGITCLGNATIILSGTNTVKGFDENYPGIQAASGKTLTINGTGSLTASSNGYSAGIGGGSGIACGNIEIQGGTITANGGNRGAGIGGAYNASWGNITISGGTVNATGGDSGAGIGGGKRFTANVSSGNITISGGTVTATGGADAAGIGGGRGNNNNYKSSCGTITITTDVTKVTATIGDGATNNIGAGKYGTCGTVTIGGNVGAITDSPYTYQP